MYFKEKLDKLIPLDGINIYGTRELQDNEKNKKQLKNSAKIIGKGIDTSKIIGLFDMSFFNDGKEGALFTGTDIYIRESFSELIHIKLNELNEIKYQLSVETNEKGKEKKIHHLIYMDNEKVNDFTSTINDTGNLYKQVVEVLSEFNEKVENISSTEQDLALDSLGDEAILTYLKIVFQYLNSDRVIERREMLNMAGLLNQLDVSSEIDNNFREYRFNNGKEGDNISLLVDELKVYVPEGSQDTIFQSLINDLLVMKNDKELADWESDIYLLNLIKILGVSKDKVEFFVRTQILTNRQINERLEDGQIKELSKQVLGFGAGAGASLAALTATGAVVGAFGEFGLGALAIATMSTGGIALAAAGIGAAGIAGYKGIDYLTSANGKEKYAIRNELLQNGVKKLIGAQQFLLNDINIYVEQMNDILYKKNGLKLNMII